MQEVDSDGKAEERKPHKYVNNCESAQLEVNANVSCMHRIYMTMHTSEKRIDNTDRRPSEDVCADDT
eukprot:1626289-Pleurochrysis_carterae.AAC.4